MKPKVIRDLLDLAEAETRPNSNVSNPGIDSIDIELDDCVEDTTYKVPAFESMECSSIVSGAAFGLGDQGTNHGWFAVLNLN